MALQNHSLSATERETQCVLHWFRHWSSFQKRDFQQDLLDKLLPGNVDTLFDSMNSLGVSDKPPSIFKCQLKLFSEWFANWTDAERNAFIIQLRTIDADFVNDFESEASRLSQGRTS